MKIVTLTLCPAFDIHCEADVIEVNHENIASVVSRDAGGKGVNISRALSCFGVENTAIIALGDDGAEAFSAALYEDAVSFIPISYSGRIRENITIHTKDGRETRISFKGTDTPPELISRVGALTDELCGAGDIVTLSGRLPLGLNIEDAKSYVKRLQARGIRVVIDSRSFTLEDIIEVKPYLIKPNEEEIEAYVNRKIKTSDDAIAAARELHLLGIENVMISLGAAGAVIASAEGEFYTEAPRIESVSTIGAGDSSIAGFLTALSSGEEIRRCLEFAVAFGSAACLRGGTKPLSVDDVKKFI